MVTGWQMTPPHRDQVTAEHALGDLPDNVPEAIAGLIAFLVTDAVAPVSVAILPADGAHEDPAYIPRRQD
jgi:hypothetical protein